MKKLFFDRFEGGIVGVANGLRCDVVPLYFNGTHPWELWAGINVGVASYFQLMGEGPTAEASRDLGGVDACQHLKQ